MEHSKKPRFIAKPTAPSRPRRPHNHLILICGICKCYNPDCTSTHLFVVKKTEDNGSLVKRQRLNLRKDGHISTLPLPWTYAWFACLIITANVCMKNNRKGVKHSPLSKTKTCSYRAENHVALCFAAVVQRRFTKCVPHNQPVKWFYR